ncbi:PAS domain-containing hybrid sensor histidine kinase/response regulator [Pengzhenrongella sicca]|uniref:histidine kinase n=1 Tax=Pengzhenrongella sicca TaxID=2819238 RepID=A0A8A4ZGK2_9MICO|nr:PAS domain-containing hybrid sensor histidine kinase/response regulator [Pengzhenrongella sicca]QTE30119.1 PAS domain S-box protein [Pengzhenrongella sicca]
MPRNDEVATETAEARTALTDAIFTSAYFWQMATDERGVIQIFNVGAERMLGYAAADVVDKITPADISDPPELISRAAELSAELDTPIAPGFEALVFKAKRGIEDIYELTYVRKDGSRFPAIVSVTALSDPDGAIIGYLLIGTDNTAGKARAALSDAIFTSAYFWQMATDERGVIQIFNVGAERMLGYAAADVVDKITPADISDPQELISRAAELSAELDTPIAPGFEALVFKAKRGIEDIYELTYVRKDGSRFPAIVSVTALSDPDGAIIGYLLIGTDNTAGKEVEAAQALLDQQLRDQQFYTRSLIESNIDALMTTDPAGIITDVNQQMIALTGRLRGELVGTPCRTYFTDPVRADAAIERVLTEHKVSDYELTVRARDGAETYVSYNAATFHDRDHRLQGVFAAARDVTDRRRIERALLEKNVELEHASRMKSEFLATMSHELRTPLNSVIGFSEVLKDGIVGELSESQREYVGYIFASGQHLLALINDILDLSKVEAGMMDLELESADVAVLMASSMSIVREKAAERQIELDLVLADDLGIWELDVRKTKQVVYNLLSNAVKFSDEHGLVSLRARHVPRRLVGASAGPWPVRGFELADNEFRDFLEICVTDDGIGISEANLAKLFEPFTQIDSGLARKFEGTGLGLAMVKQITELLGGSVAVASKEGEGAAFTTWIPLRAHPHAAAVERVGVVVERAPGARAATKVALVVEDDDGAADLVRLILEAEGFSVLRSISADDALVQLPQQGVDLILVDIQLPQGDGWAVMSAVRRDSTLSQVPIVIISGTSTGQLVAVSAGAAAILQKPVSRGDLVDALAGLGFHEHDDRTRTVLVVDDDPQAVELIAAYLPMPACATVRAYGGIEAIVLAKQLRPDLVVLDLMMPDLDGFDVVHSLKSDLTTATIPILVVTSKIVTPQDRLALHLVQGTGARITATADFSRADFVAELRRSLRRTKEFDPWPPS